MNLLVRRRAAMFEKLRGAQYHNDAVRLSLLLYLTMERDNIDVSYIKEMNDR
jgi:hypothetical protein